MVSVRQSSASPTASCLNSTVTPIPQVVTGGHGPPGLDYGVLVGGSSVSLPLQLTNHGLAELPLQLSISAVSTTH